MSEGFNTGEVVEFNRVGGHSRSHRKTAVDSGFVVHEKYTIVDIEPRDWDSLLSFKEIPGWWSSAMFSSQNIGMTRVWIETHTTVISDYEYEDVSEYGSWSREASYNVFGAHLRYNDLSTLEEFAVPNKYAKAGSEVYVLWVEYSTGDSFGTSTGNGEIMWVFGSETNAEEAKKLILREQDKVTIKFVDELGHEIGLSNPAWGYFEDLLAVHITKLVLND